MFFLNKDIESKTIVEGLNRKVLAADGKMMITEMNFEPNVAAALHSHPHEQVTYIVNGKVLFKLGEEELVMVTGDSVYCPPDVPHSVTSIDKSVVIDVFTPQREDFK